MATHYGKCRLESEMRYLNNDAISNEDRWLFDNTINLSLNGDADLKLINKRVSDKSYFKEIALEGTSKERLISSLSFNKTFGGLEMNAYSEAEQLVNSGQSNYTKAGEIRLAKQYSFNSFNIDLNNTSTNFHHKNTSNSEVLRNHQKISISRNFKELEYEIIPTISLSNTNYQFNKLPNNKRFIYSSDIIARLFLERELKILNEDFIQTLVPILQYSYTPKKNQNLIPNFDTESVDNDTFDSFFAANSFLGSDKISNQNNISLGIESEFINDNSGDTILTLKAAQKFYLDDQVMNSSGYFVKTRDSKRGYSDINASLEFNLPFFTLAQSINFNPDDMRSGNTRSSMEFRGSGRNNLELSYLDHNSNQSARLTSVFDINETDHFFLRADRDLTADITNNVTFGLARENCCIAFRFAFFKKHRYSDKYSYKRAYELVFKGLTTTTPSLRERIEAEIPDYIGDLDNNL